MRVIDALLLLFCLVLGAWAILSMGPTLGRITANGAALPDAPPEAAALTWEVGPAPTLSVQPTARPHPTATPYPTYTPAPTYTPGLVQPSPRPATVPPVTGRGGGADFGNAAGIAQSNPSPNPWPVLGWVLVGMVPAGLAIGLGVWIWRNRAVIRLLAAMQAQREGPQGEETEGPGRPVPEEGQREPATVDVAAYLGLEVEHANLADRPARD